MVPFSSSVLVRRLGEKRKSLSCLVTFERAEPNQNERQKSRRRHFPGWSVSYASTLFESHFGKKKKRKTSRPVSGIWRSTSLSRVFLRKVCRMSAAAPVSLSKVAHRSWRAVTVSRGPADGTEDVQSVLHPGGMDRVFLIHLRTRSPISRSPFSTRSHPADPKNTKGETERFLLPNFVLKAGVAEAALREGNGEKARGELFRNKAALQQSTKSL